MSVRNATSATPATPADGGGRLSERLRAVLTLADAPPDTQGWLPAGQPDYSRAGCDPPPKPGDKRGLDDDDRCVCAICFAPLEEWEEHGAPFLLGRTCEHQFHGKCLSSFVDSKQQAQPDRAPPCPTCRVPMDPADVADLRDPDGWVRRVRENYKVFADVPADSNSYLEAGLVAAERQPYWTMKNLKESAPIELYVQIAKTCVEDVPLALYFVPPQLLGSSYWDVAYLAMFNDGDVALKFVPAEPFRFRKSLVEVAVREFPQAMRYVRIDDQNYARLADMAVRNDPTALRHVKPHAEYAEVAKKAVAKDGMLIRYVPAELATEPELWRLALKSKPLAIQYLPHDHPDAFELAMLAMQAPVRKGQSHPLQVVRHSGPYAFASSPSNFRRLLREAIKHDKTGKILSFAPESVRADSEIAVEAVKKSWKALEFVPPDAADFGAIASIAVVDSKDAMKLVSSMIPPSHPDYKRIASESVIAWPKSIVDVNPFFKEFAQVAILAVSQDDSTALGFVAGTPYPPDAVRWHPFDKDYAQIALAAVRAHPEALEFVSHDEPMFIEIAEVALRRDPSVADLVTLEDNLWYFAVQTMREDIESHAWPVGFGTELP